MKNKIINLFILIISSIFMILILEFFFSCFIEVPKPKSALPEGLINNKYISYLTPNFKGDFQNKVSATINIIAGLEIKKLNMQKTKKSIEF